MEITIILLVLCALPIYMGLDVYLAEEHLATGTILDKTEYPDGSMVLEVKTKAGNKVWVSVEDSSRVHKNTSWSVVPARLEEGDYVEFTVVVSKFSKQLVSAKLEE